MDAYETKNQRWLALWVALYVNPYNHRKEVERAEKWRKEILRRRRQAAEKRAAREVQLKEQSIRRTDDIIFQPTAVGVYGGRLPRKSRAEVIAAANQFMHEW